MSNSNLSWSQKFKLKYGKDKSPVLGILFTMPAIILMSVLLFIPMGYQLRLSLYDTSLINPEPIFLGMEGYVEMMQSPTTATVFSNAAVWTISVVLLQFLVGFWAALTLNNKFFGRTLLRGFVIIPWIMPGVVAAMVWRLFYDARLGFLNTVLRNIGLLDGSIDWLGMPDLAMGSAIMVAVWKGFGFSALMLMAGLQGVSKELYEASSVDGANAFQRFFSITLPSMKNIIATTLLLTSMWTFNYFEIIFVLTGGGPLHATQIPPTHIYELAFRNFNLGDSARFAVISFFLVGTIAMLYVRNVRKRGEI